MVHCVEGRRQVQEDQGGKIATVDTSGGITAKIRHEYKISWMICSIGRQAPDTFQHYIPCVDLLLISSLGPSYRHCCRSLTSALARVSCLKLEWNHRNLVQMVVQQDSLFMYGVYLKCGSFDLLF